MAGHATRMDENRFPKSKRSTADRKDTNGQTRETVQGTISGADRLLGAPNWKEAAINRQQWREGCTGP